MTPMATRPGKAVRRRRNVPVSPAVRAGLAALAAGRIKVFKNAKELIADLHRTRRRRRAE